MRASHPVTRKDKTFGGETREDQIARWAEEHRAGVGAELREVAETLLVQRETTSGPGRWSERDVLLRALAEVCGGGSRSPAPT